MKKQFLTVCLVCCLSIFAAATRGQAAPSAAELKRMSTFLSNFTELGFMNLDAREMASAKPPADLVRFGIWHNYMNNYKSRILPCKTKDCKWGSLTIEGKYVTESVKKYFGIDCKPVSITESDPPYHYDGKRYHFEGADGEAVYYARVDKAIAEASGNIRMTGEIYNTDDESDKPARFEAVAKPHTFGGKNTWAIISLKTTYYNEENAANENSEAGKAAANGQDAGKAAAGQDADTGKAAGQDADAGKAATTADFLPVFIDSKLAGGFANGEWLEGDGGVTLNGKAIKVDEIREEDIEKYNNEGTLEMSRVRTGRKLAYFSPMGEVGEGVITGVSLSYSEAAGVESEILFFGYTPEHGKLIVGVAEGIDAVPAPTTREEAGKGFTFSCEYKGVKYSVELQPQPSEKGDSHGEVVKAKLSAGERSWDIAMGDESTAWWPESSREGEILDCGFFDLNGDGSLEFVINAPGPNGSASLFRMDAETGAKFLTSVYTGEE